ncbi:anionic trypsin-2-like isoform X2 [Takifugu rubripes]|uniref:Anionic trypsin-2-like n=1 Tax=Takifugu rubripes TaxID=31033 RepID=A0A674MZE9_TAKRU|nr:anionic trypsin-2-like isoform X2 [Takifugu rubripes]
MAMITNLLFVLAFGLTVTTEVDLHKRIIAGRNCTDEERPYHVKFQYASGCNRCGASLISDRWILTAAHCWNNSIPMRAMLSPHPGPGQEARFFQSPYFLNNESGRPDIMLLKLEQKTTTPYISLPNCTKRHIQKGDVVQIAGYGYTEVDCNMTKVRSEPQVLQCADFKVKNRQPYTYGGDNLTTQVFDVNTDQADPSPGDSGGGVVFNNAIYGVIIEAGHTTAHVVEASFVDVCHYIDSIKEIMARHA